MPDIDLAYEMGQRFYRRVSYLLTPEQRAEGLILTEESDDTVTMYDSRREHYVATFSQGGARVETIREAADVYLQARAELAGVTA